ncbi:MAG: hypothetical protein AAF408_08335, partial [Pseudomonadota bacterium]
NDGMTTADLKAMIKLARKQPVAFAFNPGKSDDEHYLSMDRRKKPEVLGKAAKKDGPSPKVSFGTAEAEGKLFNLTCEKQLPTMAKKVKKFLKSQKITMNVQIMDASGNVLDSDIEDLPDDPNEDQDQEQTGQGADLSAYTDRLTDLVARLQDIPEQAAEQIRNSIPKVESYIQAEDANKAGAALDKLEAVVAKLVGTGAPETQPEPTAAPQVDPKAAVLKRINAVKAAIGNLAGEQKDKLLKALTAAAAAFKAGDLDKTGAVLDKIETALAGLGGQTAPDQQSESAPPAPPPPDDEKAALVQKINALRGHIGLVEQEAQQAKLMDALKKAAAQFKSGELNVAAEMLARIETALANLKSATDSPPDSPQETPEQEPSPEVAQCLSRVSALEPRKNEAASKGLVEDVNKLNLQWDRVQDALGNEDYGTAMSALDLVEQMLDEGRGDGQSAFAADVASDVKPFAEARLKWNSARGKMSQEMEKLITAIRSACDGDEELQDVAKNVDELVGYLANLDDTLEDKLDAIVNTEPGEERDSRKIEALSTLNDYQNELNDPFFADVDSNNGFASVSVAATAQQALADIGRVLNA